MNLDRFRSYRVWLFFTLVAMLIISAATPPFHGYFWLENALTVGVLAFMAILEWRGIRLSNAACSVMFVYLVLHQVGAHYTYTRVPYDEWSEYLFGFRITNSLDLQRNHYDRVIHFGFGLLLLLPMQELVQRFMRLGVKPATLVAAAFLMSLSSVYELVEWLIAELLSEEAAESYNGQQGDYFDAQKDVALAFVGTFIAAIAVLIVRKDRANPNALRD